MFHTATVKLTRSGPIGGCKMVPKLGARWGHTICLPKFQNDFKQI